jgi:predicted TIM-barrel fold metal-dependent hydrolase
MILKRTQYHSHTEHHQGDPEKIEKTVKINTFHIKMLAYYLDKLAATKDGDGSLLDHSMLLWGASLGSGDIHSPHDLPIAVVGGGCGQLKGGRWLDYPLDTPFMNFVLAMLEKSGAHLDAIGDSTGMVTAVSPGTVIVEASPRLEDNTWLLELSKDDPFVVGVVGHVDPGTPEFARHVKQFAANPLFRGIRISSGLLDELLKKGALTDLKLLADHDLALDVNGGPETPAILARLAPQLPALRIVLNHIGNVHVTTDAPPREWQEGIRAAAGHSNVFCKISALVESAARNGKQAPADLAFYRPYIDVVWNAFGNDRVIYGSDWPVATLATTYARWLELILDTIADLPSGAQTAVLSGTAQRVYRL